MGGDGRQTELPDRWQADFRHKAGDGRPLNSSSILAEVSRATTNYSVRSTEWAADKEWAESDFESSRVDFMMVMSDGPQCKRYHLLFEGIILILGQLSLVQNRGSRLISHLLCGELYYFKCGFFLFALRLALTDVLSFSTCTAVVFFACISTVIDVATHRPTPTPFGTQHIALLLAAWGPVVVFGMFPSCISTVFMDFTIVKVIFRL
jgi:hypothetical protein